MSEMCLSHAMRPHSLNSIAQYTQQTILRLTISVRRDNGKRRQRRFWMCVFVYSSEANRYFHKHIVEKVLKLLICYHEMRNFRCGRWFFCLVSSWMGGGKWLFYAMNYLKTILEKTLLCWKWTASEQSHWKGVSKFILSLPTTENKPNILYAAQFFFSLLSMTYQLRWAASLLEQLCVTLHFCEAQRTMAFKIKSWA